MRKFALNHAVAMKADGVRIVSFDVSDGSSDSYIILQLSDDEDDQDRRLRLRGMHLEINDQRHSAYGSVRSICISRDSVRIIFDPALLGLPSDYSPLEIRSKTSGRDLSEIRRMLFDMGKSASVPVSDSVQ